MKKLLTILVGACLLATVALVAVAYSFGVYSSPTDMPQTFYYCADIPPGDYNVHPCADRYRNTLVRAGFYERTNLFDSRIRCQDENPVCTNDYYVIPMALTYPDNYAYQHSFRIYVPAGAQNVTITLFVPETSVPDIGIVCRMGIPPQGDLGSLTWNDFPNTDTGYRLSEMRQRDCLARRFGGHITVGGGFQAEVQTWEAGYLYVNVLYFGGSYIYRHAIGVGVNVAPFLAWYSGVDWNEFQQQYQAPQLTLNAPEIVYECEPVNVSIALDPGSQTGQGADWWIVANDGATWYSWIYGQGWIPGIYANQANIFALSGIEVLNMTLPAGQYHFYFALDNNADGVPDVTWMVDKTVLVVQ